MPFALYIVCEMPLNIAYLPLQKVKLCASALNSRYNAHCINYLELCIQMLGKLTYTIRGLCTHVQSMALGSSSLE